MTEVLLNIDQDGEIFSGKTLLTKALKEHRGERVRVTVEKYRKKRSDMQLRYYFGCVIEFQIQGINEMWGEILSKDEMHSYNKANYFCKEVFNKETGEVEKLPQSSTKFTTTDWELVMEKIRQDWQTKFNVMIPLPGEQIKAI